MPYDIVPHPTKEGRFRVVNSGTGKVWKTDYATAAGAAKAIAYIEGRFSAPGTQESPLVAPTDGADIADTAAERVRLGIPPKVTPDEDTEGW